MSFSIESQNYYSFPKDWNPEIYLAEELNGRPCGFALGAERALMSALLFDGIQAFLNYVAAESEKERSKYKEAVLWIKRRGVDYIFAFDSVCESLGVNPDFLRCGLLNVANSSRDSVKKIRRTF